MKPKRISSKIVESNQWTTIVKEEMLFEDGKKGEYLIVEKQPALMIIPLIVGKGGFYTYLVKQYRYPIEKEVWQFPAGSLEPSKDPILHAKEELKEETGLTAGKIELLGEFYVDPGLSRQKCYVYLAEDISEGGSQDLGETEKGMETARFKVEELEKILQSDIKDSWGYSGLTFLKNYLKTKSITSL